jgi:hypothetical protein
MYILVSSLLKMDPFSLSITSLKMNLLEYCNANSREYTYIGIGSKNRTADLENYTPSMDQILPCFLHIVKDKTIRAIHFDPMFAPQHDNGFLRKYFTTNGFIQVEDYMWRTQDHTIEVLIIPQVFNDNTFLYEMIRQMLMYSTKLVVQLYTGDQLFPVFENLYNCFNTSEKEYIKQNVLFDITYGTDCHCMTDMTKHQPMTNDTGEFYNFLLYNEKEMMNSIGILPAMDKLIEIDVKKKLEKLLNEECVNYRKLIRGEELMFPSRFNTPQEIMNNLLQQVSKLLEFLKKLGVLSLEKQELFKTCSNNYETEDVYRWYSEMTKLYK